MVEITSSNQGLSSLSPVWKFLGFLDIVGWMSVFLVGATAIISPAWFLWVVPLSLVLLVKTVLLFPDLNDVEEKDNV